jgi:D-arabinose 1-dehydrogenase-like Zn-dependent alcohol dehydrogenase
MDLNALLESQQTRQHKLGSVADGVDRAVLNNNALVAHEQTLQRRDDLAQVGLVTVVVVYPLRVENVVQGNQVLGLVHGSTPDTAELLHVGTHTEQKTHMYAKGTDVSSGLAADPENT